MNEHDARRIMLETLREVLSLTPSKQAEFFADALDLDNVEVEDEPAPLPPVLCSCGATFEDENALAAHIQSVWVAHQPVLDSLNR